VTLACRAGLARADEPVDPFTEPDESELLRAEERVVTVASRYAQTLPRASSVVTVITAAEIREQGQRTLADVLSAIPGVYIAVSKEGRRLAWVRGVTGSDNDQILLLVAICAAASCAGRPAPSGEERSRPSSATGWGTRSRSACASTPAR
jgi:outer membrane cobalamin receptor